MPAGWMHVECSTTPSTRRRSPWLIVGLAFGAVLAFVLIVVVVGFIRYKRQSDALRVQAAQASARIAEAEINRPPLKLSTPEQRRRYIASAVWDDFDNLSGPRFRTKEMLMAHLMRANQTLSGLPDDEASPILEYNKAEFRKRFAVVAIAGESGTATGDGFTVIVPPGDNARCNKFATSWLSGEMKQTLLAVNYDTIMCPRPDGTFEAWRLSDGKHVVTPKH